MRELVRIIAGEYRAICGYTDLDKPNEDGTYTIVSHPDVDHWETRKKRDEFETFE